MSAIRIASPPSPPPLTTPALSCILLGSASGEPGRLAELFGTRMDMLLERMLDTTARAVVFEAAGPAGPELLAAGAERVRHWCDRSLIPYR